jgi:hypothetical protein
MDRAEKYTATTDTLDHIAALVVQTRPAWDLNLVRSILAAHAHQVDGADLAVAAIRCAMNLDLHWPKAIGWRGAHWDGLDTKPPEARNAPLCYICHKPEPRCYTERPGRDDDHHFEPAPSTVVTR